MALKRLSELMTRDTEPHLLPSTLYGTLIAAVRKNLIATNLLAYRFGPSSIKGSSIDVVTEDRDSAAVHTISEGQEVPIDLMETSTFNMKPVKYGYRPLITKEMQEDGQWDMIQKNIELAGYKMADKLDSLILAEIETAAALTTDDNGATRSANTVSGSTALTIKNITDAMALLKSGVMNPTKRLIGTIFGMRVWVSNNVTSNYAYVIDKNHALALAEKRPITIERYDDVTRDLSGVVITARWKARYLRPDANAYITTS